MKVVENVSANPVIANPTVVTSVSAGKGAATDLPGESRSPWIDTRPAVPTLR